VITNCYSSSTVSGSSNSGGISYANVGTYNNCFHIGPAGAGTLKTLAQLSLRSTYTSWDFGLWGMKDVYKRPSLYTENGNIYWTGLGADNNWSTLANWNRNRLPLSSDIVLFNNISVKDCTINIPVNVACIQIGLNYSGTITQNQPVTLLNDYVQQAGIFLQDATFLVYGIGWRSGGTFTKSGASFTIVGTNTGL
jgi:hypothetical protein